MASRHSFTKESKEELYTLCWHSFLRFDINSTWKRPWPVNFFKSSLLEGNLSPVKNQSPKTCQALWKSHQSFLCWQESIMLVYSRYSSITTSSCLHGTICKINMTDRYGLYNYKSFQSPWIVNHNPKIIITGYICIVTCFWHWPKLWGYPLLQSLQAVRPRF